MKQSYEKYRNCSDERLHKFVSDNLPHVILKQENKCPFYQTDGLCQIHKEYGEEYLCETCRTYPRFVSQYEDLYTFCLAPSCPAVLDILWNEAFTGIHEEIFYESQDEVGSMETVFSEEIHEKLRLRKKLVEIFSGGEESCGECMKSAEQELDITIETMPFSEAVSHILEFAVNYCLINDRIRHQAEKINKITKEELPLSDFPLVQPEISRFFKQLLIYCIFEQIMRIEISDGTKRKEWLEKIWLQIVTIQYWIYLLYEATGTLTQEECSIAVYSIMRVLNHSEEILEECYLFWKKIGKVPEILW